MDAVVLHEVARYEARIVLDERLISLLDMLAFKKFEIFVAQFIRTFWGRGHVRDVHR